MKTVGLDLSLLATGICVLDGNSVEELRITTELVKNGKASSVGDSIRRLLSIAGRIVEVINSTKPDFVVVEAAAKNQVWQAAAIGELHGVVKTKILELTGMVPMVEQATRMRKNVVGTINSKRESFINEKGKVTKRVSYGTVPGKIAGKFKRATVKDLIESRLREQGYTFNTQDEMDAYVAARFAWNEHMNR